MDANEHFEMIANEFYLDTGYLAPGKNESPVAYYEGRDREREVAFEVWNKMRKQIITLRASIDMRDIALDKCRAALKSAGEGGK